MKFRKILSICISLLAIVSSIVGFVLVKESLTPVTYIKFFTLVTNLLIVIVSFISIGYSVESLMKKDKESVLPTPIFILKLITAVCALVTFLTVVTYLQHTVYVGVKATSPSFWNNIFHHYVAPLAFVTGLVLTDLDQKYNFKVTYFGPLVLLIYMIYAIPLSNADLTWWGAAPYVFMDWDNVKWWIFALVPGFLLGGYGLGLLVWFLNRISYLIFIGEEVKDDETSEEEKEAENKVEVTPEDEEKVTEMIKTGYTGPRIYHVSKREDKMWQVKFATGKKAIKLFPTQAEAIVFAKKLAKSQEGSIRVHSLKGKIRKAH